MIDEFGEFIKDTSKHLNVLKKDKNKLPIEDQENSWLNKIIKTTQCLKTEFNKKLGILKKTQTAMKMELRNPKTLLET